MTEKQKQSKFIVSLHFVIFTILKKKKQKKEKAQNQTFVTSKKAESLYAEQLLIVWYFKVPENRRPKTGCCLLTSLTTCRIQIQVVTPHLPLDEAGNLYKAAHRSPSSLESASKMRVISTDCLSCSSTQSSVQVTALGMLGLLLNWLAVLLNEENNSDFILYLFLFT